MYRILSVSRNVNLLLSRNDALAMAGFTVVSPRTPEEAPLLAAERDVDAVIIGHSVEQGTRERIVAAVRHVRPASLVVFVYAFPDTKGDPTADLSIDVTDGPEKLIAALQERFPRSTPA
jgi:DNA-binding NtrC family response regulator